MSKTTGITETRRIERARFTVQATAAAHRAQILDGTLHSAKLLDEHFKTREALAEAGVVGQLTFLLHEDSDVSAQIHAYLSLGWLDHSVKAIEENPTDELFDVAFEIIACARNAGIPTNLPHV